MIDWMQKHKKYLIVTIWISTIAFIGAGSVGWGDYNISRSSDVVAVVGELDVKYQEVNGEYNRVFALIKEKNPSFDQESATKMKLQDTALRNIVNRKYLFNFANDIGLLVTSDEVLNVIVSNRSFYVDDKFSKENYKRILKENNAVPSEYEQSISESILLEKVLSIFTINLSDIEQRLSDMNTKLENEVKITVIDSSSINMKHTDKDRKKFWEENKNNYLTDKKYMLDTLEVAFGNYKPSKEEIQEYFNANKLKFEDGNGSVKNIKDVRDDIVLNINKKQAEEKAKRLYYDVKNKKIKTTQTLEIERRSSISSSAFTEITKYKKGNYIKPIELEDKYIVGFMKDVIEPRVMTYEQASQNIDFFLTEKVKKEGLELKAKDTLKNFKGKLVGFISKENYFDMLKGHGLDRYESNNFVFNLMDSQEKKGYFIIDKKAVVYEIVSQKLPQNITESIKLDSLDELKSITQNDDTLLNAKNQLIQNSILEYFKNKYEVTYLANIDSTQ